MLLSRKPIGSSIKDEYEFFCGTVLITTHLCVFWSFHQTCITILLVYHWILQLLKLFLKWNRVEGMLLGDGQCSLTSWSKSARAFIVKLCLVAYFIIITLLADVVIVESFYKLSAHTPGTLMEGSLFAGLLLTSELLASSSSSSGAGVDNYKNSRDWG